MPRLPRVQPLSAEAYHRLAPNVHATPARCLSASSILIWSRLQPRREKSASIAAEPRRHGGSPRIHSGEERFSAPIRRRLSGPCCQVLGAYKCGRLSPAK